MRIEFEDDIFNSEFATKKKTPKYISFFRKIGIRNNKIINLILILFVFSCLVISINFFKDVSKDEGIEYNISPEVLETLPPNIKNEIRNANG